MAANARSIIRLPALKVLAAFPFLPARVEATAETEGEVPSVSANMGRESASLKVPSPPTGPGTPKEGSREGCGVKRAGKNEKADGRSNSAPRERSKFAAA